jgi:GntR family carbon starvation induced transcriptional regulator
VILHSDGSLKRISRLSESPEIDATTSAASGNEATLALSVFFRLRADVLDGTLKPGSRLAMAELRHRYSIGLSPLREALSRLVGEGLVTTEGQRGFRVAPFSAADVDDLMFIWQIIEEGALRAAMASRDEHWEASIVAAFHVLERRIQRAGSDSPGERASYEEAHRTFHLALTAGAASPRAAQIQRALYDQARRYRLLVFRDLADPKTMLEEYRQLMHLVLTYQTEAAVAKLRALLSMWRDGVRRLAGW